MVTPVDGNPAPPEGYEEQPYAAVPTRNRGETAVRWSIIGLLLFLVIGLAFGLGVISQVLIDRDTGASTSSARTNGEFKADGAPNFAVLDDIYQAFKDYYVDPDGVNAELLRNGAINGMISSLGDTHQMYLSRRQAELDDTDLKGQFEGIGASVDQRGGEIVIVRPFDESPAKAAGIKPGDVIVMIDGKSTKGLTSTDAVRLIRGQQGTTVKLQVRHSDGKVEDLSIVRDAIKVASVKPDKPQDAQGNVVEDVAYVRIEQFTARTSDELKAYLQSIQGKGYKGLIIDLRNNPGGLLDAVSKVGEQFMRRQTLLIEQERGGKESVFQTGSNGIATDPSLKIAVLVNRNSASASEILAGAIRDNGRGVVLGESTLGKGTVNRFIPLASDGGKVYVTVGRWLTPKRDQIEGRGIRPDIEVRVPDDESTQEYYNSYMFRAVDLIRSGS